MVDKRLISLLVDKKLITQDQLAIALESQKTLGDPLEKILIDKKFVTEEQLLKALAAGMNTSFISLPKYKIDVSTAKLLPVSLAKKHHAIPIFRIEDKVTIATSNPLDLDGLEDIRNILGLEISPVFALESDINNAIREVYRGTGLMEAGSGQLEFVRPEDENQPEAGAADNLKKAASGKEIVLAVNNIITEGFNERTSDIHIEPTRDSVIVRFRIDGVLEEFSALSKQVHLPVISRIKIIGGMDVAERRVPQDGRVRVKIGGKEVDLRIATYPTMFGEAAAIRLLSKGNLITLESLGLSPEELEIFKELILKPHGIFLVTGPTGSGKTTTLYASLMKINSKDKHILSIEDPVENEIPGVDQQQVNLKAGLTFATSLRAMLRQDPDVIMVGEIRDSETADIATRAAMTGHLVFSTLHTNDAVGAIARLSDLGVDPFLISSTMLGVLSQRLVRKVCTKCAVEADVDPKDARKLGDKTLTKQMIGKGCKACRNTGYLGRIGIFEMVTINDQIKQLIVKKATEADIYDVLSAGGHRTIVADGVQKIKAGVTTAAEVLRVAS